jgi:hypothetical protein
MSTKHTSAKPWGDVGDIGFFVDDNGYVFEYRCDTHRGSWRTWRNVDADSGTWDCYRTNGTAYWCSTLQQAVVDAMYRQLPGPQFRAVVAFENESQARQWEIIRNIKRILNLIETETGEDHASS